MVVEPGATGGSDGSHQAANSVLCRATGNRSAGAEPGLGLVAGVGYGPQGAAERRVERAAPFEVLDDEVDLGELHSSSES